MFLRVELIARLELLGPALCTAATLAQLSSGRSTRHDAQHRDSITSRSRRKDINVRAVFCVYVFLCGVGSSSSSSLAAAAA